MKTALKQYNLKSTTMSERMEEVKGAITKIRKFLDK